MLTTVLYSLLVIIPALLIMSVVAAIKSNRRGKSPRRASRVNFAAFGLLVMLVGIMSVGVFAEQPEATDDVEQQQTETAETGANGLGLLAAALVTGLAGIGGGLAVAAGAPAAIAATSEDPKSFGKSIIFVALGESIALYGVVISILILQKV